MISLKLHSRRKIYLGLVVFQELRVGETALVVGGNCLGIGFNHFAEILLSLPNISALQPGPAAHD